MEYKQKKVFLSVILITMIFFSEINLFASPRNVYDNAALFTEAEVEVLDKKAVDCSEKLMIDFIIITTSDNKDKTVEDYAQDFYSQNGLGYGVEQNALLMLFDMDSKQLYVSPFSNDGTDNSSQEFKLTYDEIRAKFGSDNFYYAAATTYMDTIESFINENDIQIVANTAPQSNTTSQNNTAPQSNMTSQNNTAPQNNAAASGIMGIYVLTAITLGGLISWLMIPKMDHTYMNDMKIKINVGDYLENNALNIVDKQDRHINTRMEAM